MTTVPPLALDSRACIAAVCAVEPSFIVLTLAMCLLSRVCSTFPMAALANVCRTKGRRVALNEQAVIWFSGLRGAIALALAVEFPTAAEVRGRPGEGNFCHQREHVVACTIVVVLCTCFLMGGFTKPVLNLCGIQMGAEASDRVRPAPEATRETSRRRWKRALYRFHANVLRPVLVADVELELQARSPMAREVLSMPEAGAASAADRPLPGPATDVSCT